METLKNIVIVNDFDYVQGGASKVAIDTANLLSKQNYKVYFFSAVHSDKSNLDKKVISVCTYQNEALHEKNKFKGFINGIYNFKAKNELKKLLKKLNKNETIIHFHGWTKALSSSVFDIAFKMDFKVVLTLHDYFTACPNGGYFNYKRTEPCSLRPLSWKCIKCNCDSRNYAFKIYRLIRQFVQNKIVKLNKKLTDVISISDFSEKILRKTLNTNINIHRVYNPIDIPVSNKKIDYKKNNYFLYVGRVSKEKGVDVFCKAATELKCEAIVVGDGPELDRLKNKYSNINFVGWKDTNEVVDFMKTAKALVFPSLWYETMGMTVQEAQNIGIPVIVNENTSASDFVVDDRFKYKNYSELLRIMSNIDKYDFRFNKYSNNYINDLIKAYKKI